jgi:signal peptidase I
MKEAAAAGAPPERGQRRSRLRVARDVLSLAGFALALLAARSSLADHYYVPSGSMTPTVLAGDRVVVNKLAYGLRVPFSDVTATRFAAPSRGDVVVLRSPEDGITLLKRVVAVPGDEVAVLNGRLTINGDAVPIVDAGADVIEQLGAAIHPVRLTRGGGVDFGPTLVGADRYLVLGDNRGESHDGRIFGLVERGAIMGRAMSVWMRDGHFCWRKL